MRQANFLLINNPRIYEPPVPDALRTRSNQKNCRHMNDGLASIFFDACTANKPEKAADLLTLLEKWHARRPAKDGCEDRSAREVVQAMRAELERLTASRKS
jgi:hypothetical protein